MDYDLCDAAVRGSVSDIENLWEKINQVTADYDRNVLHLAALHGNIKSVKYILENYSNNSFITQVDKSKNTALHLAIARDDAEIVKLLVKADPDHEYPQNCDSKTPLYLAAELGHSDIVQVIIYESRTTPAYQGPDQKTALHAAVDSLNADSVRVILENRGDLVLMRDNRGWTATDYAASNNCVSLLQVLVQTENKLRNNQAYVHLFTENDEKETALHFAAKKGHISAVLELMKLYPDSIWGASNKYGLNILHLAADHSHKELVQNILQHCPDLSLILNTKDTKGYNTPLHLLVMKGCFVLELIKHERVDRTAKNNDKYTPYDSLYLHDEIVADQLKIKDAFEDSEFINQRWNFGLRKRNIPPIAAESPVPQSARSTKDAKFKKARYVLVKEEIKLYRARINTQIIVTALITTVTFTVGFTMPGGYHQSGEVDEGSALHSKKTAFSVFMLADTLALLLSMSSLALYFVASMYQDAEEISKLVDASTVLNIVSVVATMLTFVMGIYVVLPYSSALTTAISVMSGFFLLLVIILMIKVMKDPIEKFRE